MATIRPRRCFSIGLSAAWHSEKAEVRLVAITSSQSARFIRSMSWSRVMPALLTRMSSRPWRATTSATADGRGLGVGHVEGRGFGAAAGGGDLVDHRLGVGAARAGDDRRAARRERRRDGAADAA